MFLVNPLYRLRSRYNSDEESTIRQISTYTVARSKTQTYTDTVTGVHSATIGVGRHQLKHSQLDEKLCAERCAPYSVGANFMEPLSKWRSKIHNELQAADIEGESNTIQIFRILKINVSSLFRYAPQSIFNTVQGTNTKKLLT